MEIKTLLRDELTKEIQELGKIELGTDKYKLTVDGATKLADRVIELEKIEYEAEARYQDRKSESELKLKQMEDEKKDRSIKNAISIGSVVLTVGLTVWGALKAWDFETEDTVGSPTGKSFMSRLIPKNGIGFKWGV